MFAKPVIAFALLLISVAAGPLQSTLPNKFHNNMIEQEEPCVRQGGQCILAQECDPSNLVHFNVVLCPAQQHLDVICCY